MLMRSKRLLSVFICICLAAAFWPVGQITALAGNSSETVIRLADDGITVDGAAISSDPNAAVHTAADIVYYQSGYDSSYGEGTTVDEHSAQEAQRHTVVTITQAGSYRISGALSAGQLAIDLGSEARTDPSATVEIILDGADISCTVAPAVIFYNVWESGSSETAGAIVTLADGSFNRIKGSYVARIYKPGSTSKLHKYDGAFYSKQSMLVQAGQAGTGKLIIEADNEGLDSEMHLTINGGNFWITAQNDGLNANEDEVSIITINGGYMYVNAGNGVEGDGIDSNGYLYINGGTLISLANPISGDGGIDADMGIRINGGTVIALGSRNDAVSSESSQPFMELSYAATQAAYTIVRITDATGSEILTFQPDKAYQSLTFSSPALSLDTVYYVYYGGEVSGPAAFDGLYQAGGIYLGGTQQQYSGSSGFGRPMGGGMGPQGGTDPFQIPSGLDQWLASADVPADIKVWIENAREAGNRSPMEPEAGAVNNPPDIDNNLNIAVPDGLEQWLADADIPTDIKTWIENIRDARSRMPEARDRADLDGPAGMEGDRMPGMDANRMPSGMTGNQSDIQASIDFIISQDLHSFGNVTDFVQGQSNLREESQILWPFSDVMESDSVNWYYSAVKYAYENSLMKGLDSQTFAPDEPLSRAMLSTILGRMAEAEVRGKQASFADVTEDGWSSGYIAWAAENNIMSGYAESLFGQYDPVTREQACLILVNYASFLGMELPAITDAVNFADSSQISEWAAEAVEVCQRAGLIEGLPGNRVDPQGILSRAEAASLLMRLVQNHID
jgi:hypothetical protein